MGYISYQRIIGMTKQEEIAELIKEIDWKKHGIYASTFLSKMVSYNYKGYEISAMNFRMLKKMINKQK